MGKYAIHMALTDVELLALHSILWNVRLGDRNIFETAISDIVIDMDREECRGALDAARAKYGTPDLSVTASDSEGLVLQLNSAG